MPGVFSFFPLKEMNKAKQKNEASSFTTQREKSLT